jgi:hypothetical protein
MPHLHKLWEDLATLCLAIAGMIAHDYVSVISTIAVTVSAINGTITLWRWCRGKPHADRA